MVLRSSSVSLPHFDLALPLTCSQSAFTWSQFIFVSSAWLSCLSSTAAPGIHGKAARGRGGLSDGAQQLASQPTAPRGTEGATRFVVVNGLAVLRVRCKYVARGMRVRYSRVPS